MRTIRPRPCCWPFCAARGWRAWLACLPVGSWRGWPGNRPWLQVTAADVRQWLRAQGQTWVEDPSNADQRLTRNRIRAQLMPALDAAFPTFRDPFARSAATAAQAAPLLETPAQ